MLTITAANRWKSALAGVLMALPPALPAADGLRASVAATSDYVNRGISQNGGARALQASLSAWSPSGSYAGVWISEIDTRNLELYPYSRTGSAMAEVDVWAGLARRLGDDWTLDLRAAYYAYVKDPAPVGYDTVEFTTGIGWREHWTASVSLAPRAIWFARTASAGRRPAVAAELAMQQPVGRWLTWTVGAGYRAIDVPGESSYGYGSTGLAVQWRRASMEARWFATDSTAGRLFGEHRAGSRLALTGTVTF